MEFGRVGERMVMVSGVCGSRGRERGVRERRVREKGVRER